MNIVRPYLLKNISNRNCVWQIPGKEKTIYLTFDDGPIPELTPFVLETLNKFNAKATFFCVGDNARKYPGLLNEVISNGHAVGNHTYNHLDGWKKNYSEYEKNVNDGFQFIQSKMFRPPYGHITPRQINRISKDSYIVLWTVMSYDFDVNITPMKCLQNVIKFTKRGSIVVFHENKKALPRLKFALPRFISHFQEQGYEFKALNEELLQKALQTNWINASSFYVSKCLDSLKLKKIINHKNQLL